MTGDRKPAAFRLDLETAPPAEKPARDPAPQNLRTPRAIRDAELATVTPATVDYFEQAEGAAADPQPLMVKPRGSLVRSIFFGALGALVSLAIGLWADQLIRDLFARADWLGWVAVGLAAVAAAALLVIIVREALALSRLASVAKLHARGLDVLARDDMKDARALMADLTTFMAANAATAAGRKTLGGLKDEIIDGAALVRLAETELLAPLDLQARALILDAAKRVSIVTAVSPRALVDLGYVFYESARLIRRLAELYGGRPGTLGFFRLIRGVLAHLAVTGSIAAGDSLVQEVVGHGLAARLSAKLGEGVVNGMMTVRIGIAAMETTRPLPFSAQPRPRVSDFIAALARFSSRKQGGASASED